MRVFQRPCLRYSYCSPLVAVVAYVALAYAMSCIGYLIVVKCANVGSPFNDSLTSEQKTVKAKSAGTRSQIFWSCLLLSIVVLVAVRPLRATER